MKKEKTAKLEATFTANAQGCCLWRPSSFREDPHPIWMYSRHRPNPTHQEPSIHHFSRWKLPKRVVKMPHQTLLVSMLSIPFTSHHQNQITSLHQTSFFNQIPLPTAPHSPKTKTYLQSLQFSDQLSWSESNHHHHHTHHHQLF